MPVPGLAGIDPVPARDFTFAKQIVDRRAGRSLTLGSIVAKCLAEMPAFGMRFKLQQVDATADLVYERLKQRIADAGISFGVGRQ